MSHYVTDHSYCHRGTHMNTYWPTDVPVCSKYTTAQDWPTYDVIIHGCQHLHTFVTKQKICHLTKVTATLSLTDHTNFINGTNYDRFQCWNSSIILLQLPFKGHNKRTIIHVWQHVLRNYFLWVSEDRPNTQVRHNKKKISKNSDCDSIK